MSIIYLDWETYWNSADGYTLGKMSVEQYVRDPRFEAILLSVAVDDGPVICFESHFEDVLKALQLDNPDNIVYAVNMAFDGFIITDHYKIQIANPCCTRTLCRLTGVSQITGESLDSMNKFFGVGHKEAGTAVSNGKHREDFTDDEWAFFSKYGCDDVEQMRVHVKTMLEKVIPYFLEFDALSQNMYINPRLVLSKEILSTYQQLLITKQNVSMNALHARFKNNPNFADINSREEFLGAVRSRKFVDLLESLGVPIPLKASAARDKAVASAKEKLQYETDVKQIKKLEATIERGVLIPALAKTDREFLELLDHPNEDVALLCQARLDNNSSISLSRCNRFLDIANRGTLPISLAPFRAITGRFTGDNSEDSMSDSTNLQNLSKRSGDKTLRYAIQAPVGSSLVAADSAQIEARVNAWASNQDDIVEAFREGRDIYSDFGEVLFNVPSDEIRSKATPELAWMRMVAKTGILSYGYGAGGPRAAQMLLQNKVKLSEDIEEHQRLAAEQVKIYRDKFSKIKNNWTVCNQVLKKMLIAVADETPLVTGWGGPNDDLFLANSHDNIFGRSVVSVMLPDGFKIYYYNLRQIKDSDSSSGIEMGTIVYDTWDKKLKRSVTRRIYGSSLTAHTIQGLSAAIIRWQMLEINRIAPVVFQVHDEIISITPEDKQEVVLEQLIKIMQTVPPWLVAKGGETLPLDASGAFSGSYGGI